MISTSIAGYVYDSQSMNMIGMALVETDPPSESVRTGSDGKYVIRSNLKGGTVYKVTVTKPGYVPLTKPVPVVEGQNSTVEFGLVAISGKLEVDKQVIDFKIAGNVSDTQSFNISNTGESPLDWNLAFDARSWLSVSESKGNLAKGGSKTISVIADAGKYASSTGTDQSEIRITSAAGNATIKVNFQKIAADCFNFQVEPTTTIDFGTSSTVQKLYVQNKGNSKMNWAVQSTAQWLTVSELQGTTAQGAASILDLVADRSKLIPGLNKAQLDVVASSPDNPACESQKRTLYLQITSSGICVPKQTTCREDNAAVNVCKDDGSGWSLRECGASRSCRQENGVWDCYDWVCEPNKEWCLDDKTKLICDKLGAQKSSLPCDPVKQQCINGKCECKAQCMYEGKQKACGSDGCGKLCGSCTTANTKCREPEGQCVAVPPYEVNCDDTQPHSINVCLIGSFVGTSGLANASGCISSASQVCLVADTVEALVPASSEASSQSYRVESTLIQ